jgi:hypothetical protein
MLSDFVTAALAKDRLVFASLSLRERASDPVKFLGYIFFRID